MWKFLQRKANNAAEKVVRFEHKEQMEAVIAIGVVMMYASGKADDVEREQLQNILANKPELAAFGTQVQETLNRFDTLMRKSGAIIGQNQLLREIAQAKGNKEEQEDVFLTGLTIALADGQIDAEERKLLDKIGQSLGLNADNYL